MDAKEEMRRILQSLVPVKPDKFATKIFAEKKSLPPPSVQPRSVASPLVPPMPFTLRDSPAKLRSLLEAYQSQILLQTNLINSLRSSRASFSLPRGGTHAPPASDDVSSLDMDKSMRSRNAMSTRRNSLEDKEAGKSVDGLTTTLSDDGGKERNRGKFMRTCWEDGKVLTPLKEEEGCNNEPVRTERDSESRIVMSDVRNKVSAFWNALASSLTFTVGQKTEEIEERLRRMRKYAELQHGIQRELRRSAEGYKRQAERLMQDAKFADRARAELQRKVRGLEAAAKKNAGLLCEAEKMKGEHQREKERLLLAVQTQKSELDQTAAAQWVEERQRLLSSEKKAERLEQEKDRLLADMKLRLEEERTRTAAEKDAMMNRHVAELSEMKREFAKEKETASTEWEGEKADMQEALVVVREEAGRSMTELNQLKTTHETERARLLAEAAKNLDELKRLKEEVVHKAQLAKEATDDMIAQAREEERTRVTAAFEAEGKKREEQHTADRTHVLEEAISQLKDQHTQDMKAMVQRHLQENDQVVSRFAAAEKSWKERVLELNESSAMQREDLAARHRAECARLVLEAQRNSGLLYQGEKTRILADCNAQLQKCGEDWKHRMAREKELLDEQHSKALLQLRTEHAREMQAVTQQNSQEKEKLASECCNKVETDAKRWEQKMQGLESTHRTEKAAWDAERAEIVQNADTMMAKRCGEEKEAMAAECESRAREQIEKLEKTARSEREELKRQNQKAMERVMVEHKEEISALSQSFHKENAKLVKDCAQKCEKAETVWGEERAGFASRIDVLAKQHETTVAKYETQLRDERTALASTFEREKEELLKKHSAENQAVATHALEENSRIKGEHEGEIRALTLRHQKEMQELANDYAGRCEKAAHERGEAMRRQKSGLETRVGKQLEDAAAKFTREKEELLKEHAAEKSHILQKSAAAIELHTTEKAKWDSERAVLMLMLQRQSEEANARILEEKTRLADVHAREMSELRKRQEAEKAERVREAEARSHEINTERQRLVTVHQAEKAAWTLDIDRLTRQAEKCEEEKARLEDAHAREIEAVRRENGKLAENRWNEERTVLEQKVTALHKETVRLTKSYELKVGDLQKQREVELTSLAAEKAAFKKSEAEYAKEIEAATQLARSEKETMTQRLAEVQEERTKLSKAHERGMEILRKQHDSEVQSWAAEKSHMLEEQTGTLTKLKAEHLGETEALVRKFNAEKEELTNKLNAEFALRREAAENVWNSERATFTRKVEEIATQLREEKAHHEHEEKELRRQLDLENAKTREEVANLAKQRSRERDELAGMIAEDYAARWEKQRVRLLEGQRKAWDSERESLEKEHTERIETLLHTVAEEKKTRELELQTRHAAEMVRLLQEKSDQLNHEYAQRQENAELLHRAETKAWEEERHRLTERLEEQKRKSEEMLRKAGERWAGERAKLAEDHMRTVEEITKRNEEEKEATTNAMRERYETAVRLVSDENAKLKQTQESDKLAHAAIAKQCAEQKKALLDLKQEFAAEKLRISKDYDKSFAALSEQHAKEKQTIVARYDSQLEIALAAQEKAAQSFSSEKQQLEEKHKRELGMLEIEFAEEKQRLSQTWLKEREELTRDAVHKASFSALSSQTLAGDSESTLMTISERIDVDLLPRTDRRTVAAKIRKEVGAVKERVLQFMCEAKKQEEVIRKLMRAIKTMMITSASKNVVTLKAISRIQQCTSSCEANLRTLRATRGTSKAKLSTLQSQISRLNFQLMGLTSTNSKLRYNNFPQADVVSESFACCSVKFDQSQALVQSLESEVEMARLAVIQALEGEGIPVENKGSLLGLLQKVAQALQAGSGERRARSVESESPKCADGLKVRLGTTIINLEDMRKEKEYFKRKCAKMEKKARDGEATIKVLMQRLEQAKEEQKGQDLRISEMADQFQEVRTMLENACETLRAGLSSCGAKLPSQGDLSSLCNMAVAILGVNAADCNGSLDS